MKTGFKTFWKGVFARTNWARILVFVLLCLYAASMIYTLLWAFFNSLKTAVEYEVYNRNGLPQQWLFGNYLEAFDILEASNASFFEMIFNSVWLALGGSLISTATSAVAAYLFAKYEFHGKKFMYAVLLLVLMLPLYGTLPATYKLYNQLGIYDSPAILVVSASMTGQLFFILSAYFKSVSWEYAEAAQIDGAGHFYIMLKIMMPMALPAVSCVFLVALIGGWNDYTTPIYYLPNYPTVASGLYIYGIVSEFNINYPVYFAGILLSCIPTFLLFFLFRDKIMSSMTMGGLKG